VCVCVSVAILAQAILAQAILAQGSSRSLASIARVGARVASNSGVSQGVVDRWNGDPRQ
jgi:hypothetical protein